MNSMNGEPINLGSPVVPCELLDERLPADPCKPRIAESDHAEARLRSLVQNISDIITILAVDGTIQYESPSVQLTLGFKPEELVGRNAFEFIHPDDIAPLRDAFLEAIAKPGFTTSPSFRFRHANGSWVYLEGIANNLLHDPNIGGLVVTSRDVTGRHALEEQLRQAQKMEAVGQLAGGIAHDFNNTLMIIRGYCELMLDQIGPQHPLYNSTEKILKTSERASGLTGRLLAFSRKHVFAPRVVALNTLAKESATLLQKLLKSDIEISVISSEISQVLVDPGQLEQVIINLTFNARDSMPNGGKLIIETSNVEVDVIEQHTQASIPPGKYVVLAVSDTGVGMDAGTLAQIYEPFFTTKENGTGLGLAIVNTVVKQNHGCIIVSSELGKGTTFKIYFPAIQEESEPPFMVDEPIDLRDAHETILLADDEEEIREIVQRFLEQKGYTVLAARDGMEALEMAESHMSPINLLLTDVIMPRMRGTELAANLAHFHPEMKIVYMSGYAEDAGLLEGELAGGRAYLRKPFRLSEMANTLYKVLTHPSRQKDRVET